MNKKQKTLKIFSNILKVLLYVVASVFMFLLFAYAFKGFFTWEIIVICFVLAIIMTAVN